MKRWLFVVFGLIGVFLFVAFVHAQGLEGVIINEIGAYEPSGYEWVELANTSSSSISLIDWKFFENQQNHGLSLFAGATSTINPGEFAVIAQEADKFLVKYPSTTVPIFDSSWSSLSESGEDIGLKNEVGDFQEHFVYIPASTGSLERVTNTADYSEQNWKVNSNGNSLGGQNYWTTNTSATTTTITSDVTSIPSIVETIVTSTTTTVRVGEVFINEIVSDPESGSDEFVELYNISNIDVDVTGSYIEDGSKTRTILTGILKAHDFFVIEKPKGALNNSGDVVVFCDSQGTVVDSVTYGNWDDGDVTDNAPAAASPNALARKIGSMSRDSKEDFTVTTEITKGIANVIAPPMVEQTDVVAENVSVSTGTLSVTELFPNPKGTDNENEFIEVYNGTNQEISLKNWQIQTSVTKKYVWKSGVLRAGEYVVLYRKVSNLALKNSGKQTVTIRRPDQTVSDVISYEGVIKEDRSYAKNSAGEFVWTTKPTPGTENAFVLPNDPPEIVISPPESVTVGETVLFDATDTTDPEQDMLTFAWSVGNATSTGSQMSYVFAKAGNRRVSLTVTDSAGNVSKKSITVLVDSDDTALNDDSEEVDTGTLTTASVKSIAKTPTKKTSTTKAKSKTAPPIYEQTVLNDIDEQFIGKTVEISGDVSVIPPGQTYFYVIDEETGMRIHATKKIAAALHVGDRVQIRGIVKVVQSELGIQVKKITDVTMQGIGTVPELTEISLGDMSDMYIGKAVRFSGSITEMASDHLYVDDGSGDVYIKIPKKTSKQKNSFVINDNITVTGMVYKSTDEYRVLVLAEADIQKNKTTSNAPNATQEKSLETKTIAASAGGVGTVLFGIFMRIKNKESFLTLVSGIKTFFRKK